MVYSARRFVLCCRVLIVVSFDASHGMCGIIVSIPDHCLPFYFALCYFVVVIFSPFSIAITLLGDERASLGAFRTFVRFVLVWFCLIPLPLGVWEGLRFVTLAFPGLFSYPFCMGFCLELME